MTYTIFRALTDDLRELVDALNYEKVEYTRPGPWKFQVNDPEDMGIFEDLCDGFGLDYEGLWE